MKLQKILFPLLFMVSGVSAQSTVGVLGTPPNGSIVSGVSAISGYHCTSKDIEVFIDGISYGKAGAGTQILGTQGVCGRTDTGYSFLYNFSNLASGQHTVSVTADGFPLASNTITTVKSGGEQFLTGVGKQTKLPDFPHPGQAATLEWVQSYQNFMVTGIGSTADDLSSLNGSYGQNISISNSGFNCFNYPDGIKEFVISVSASVVNPNAALVYSFPSAGNSALCAYVLTSRSGNSATGYTLDGNMVCEASASGLDPVEVTNLKKAPDGLKLLGVVTIYFPGCTQTAVLY